MTRVKICGITNAADRDAAIEAGADAVGFIVDVNVDTPREIAPADAADLIEAVPPLVSTVLVTMPETPEAARALLDRTGADAIQVHGTLRPDEVADLSDSDVRVVATVGADEPDEAIEFDGVADALLVDSVSESGGGGTGRTHDWTATRDLCERLAVPVILAGGLDPDNVAEAVRTVDPFAVDVASGVEADGGAKDHDAVRRFVDRAKRAREVAR